MQFFAQQIAQLTIKNAAYRRYALTTLDAAYSADLGTGDVTTALLGVRQQHVVQAVIRAKESGVIAGLAECELFWRTHRIKVRLLKADGALVRRGEIVVQLVGTARAILTTERTTLNFLQRMSGIATATYALTKKYGKQIAGTRKTPFGVLDCRAIVLGRGLPHRLNLADQILVKENHIAVDPICWQRIKTRQPFEIEADSEKLAVAIATFYRDNPHLILMLDNFTPAQLKKLTLRLRAIHPRITLEASGGITPKNIGNYLAAGVDYVSLGYLTHSVHALDLSLQLVQKPL